MPTATAEAPQLVINRTYKSIPAQPVGGVTMYANLSFNEGIGPDRSHGSVTGHITLRQGGVEKPDVGNFVVNGTFAVNKTEDIVEYIAVHFQSAPSPFLGQQTIHGLMNLKGKWKNGHVTYSYTAEGGRPIITVPSQKIEEFPLK